MLLQENRPQFSVQDTAVTINGEVKITDENIHKPIKNDKNNKALGPRNIKMKLLKYVGERIVLLVQHA